MKSLFFYLLPCLFLLLACGKSDDELDIGEIPAPIEDSTELPSTSFEPRSIQGLHQNIFEVKCANPTCHDGSFEPDFRTVQSTYHTLVFHAAFKEDSSGQFPFRVFPFKADSSWLMERLITDDPNLGRMPLYAPMLSQEELDDVRAWINAGAPDMMGNPATLPNLNPVIVGFSAYDEAGNRVDEIRVENWDSPFIVEAGTTFDLVFEVEDDSTPSAELLINQVKCSDHWNNYNNAETHQAEHFDGNRWKISLSTNDYPLNDTIFFRYYVQDFEHDEVVEFPHDGMYRNRKQNFSFTVQP